MSTLLKLFGRDPDASVGSYLALDARQVHVLRGTVPRRFFRSSSDYVEAILPDVELQLVLRVEVRGFYPREFLLLHSPGTRPELRPIGEENNSAIEPAFVLATERGQQVVSFEISLFSLSDKTSEYEARARDSSPTPDYPFPFDFSTNSEARVLSLADDTEPDNTRRRTFSLNVQHTTPGGRLLILERPSNHTPRLFAVWLPDNLQPFGGRPEIDYHIFLHPSDNEAQRYPRGPDTFALIQRYLLEYSEFLSDRMKMIHHHKSSAKRMVFVFPIGTPARLDGVETADGLVDSAYRIHEVLCRAEGVPNSLSRVGRLALSGWSFGMGRVGRVLRNLRQSPESLLHRHLREVLLFDGPLSVPLVQTTLREARHWLSAAAENRLWIYSQDAGWHDLLSPPIQGDLQGSHPTMQATGSGQTRPDPIYIEQPNLVLFLTSQRFINELGRQADRETGTQRTRNTEWPNPPTDTRHMTGADPYDRAHVNILRYCLSHALRRSSLGE